MRHRPTAISVRGIVRWLCIDQISMRPTQSHFSFTFPITRTKNEETSREMAYAHLEYGISNIRVSYEREKEGGRRMATIRAEKEKLNRIKCTSRRTN